ncbi:universal stress protein [Pseudonocardia acaciae]|uniref:universal stress protein n=1 Tax=Pseudonocardia acaciae TaxID=551276 RepID=UPI000562A302|nr:universal stress protein [Pseudonocardia acaciae]
MRAEAVGQTVVVGVDGSESALDAARWAAGEARRRGLSLRLVNAFGWTDAQPVGEAVVTPEYREALLREAHSEVAAAAAAAEEFAPGVRVEQHVEVGFPVPVLRAEAERARLLVLGDRGLGAVLGLLIGSVAVSMAANAACPVVVVRGPDPVGLPSDLPVVVGVDGSGYSEAAIAFAHEAAAARKAPLVAVHTWGELILDPRPALLRDADAIEAAEREMLAERLAGWADKYPDLDVRRLVTRSRPANALVEWSARAQLLVVGSRGHGNFAGLILGSVSHAVVQRAECPVAVVRADTAGQA